MGFARSGTIAASLVLALASAGSGWGRPRHADRVGPTNADAISQIAHCRDIAASDTRLACFDAAAAALQQAITRKDVVVLDQEQVRKTRRSLFGFSLPNLAPFGLAGNHGDEVKEIDAKLTAVHQVAYQVYDMTLDDGAVWRNAELIDFPPEKGQTVKIRKASLGGFFMDLPSGRTVRAARVG